MATSTPAATSVVESQSSCASRSIQLAETVGYFVAFVALGLSAALTGPTLSGLAAHTRSTLSEISILFTVRSLGYMIGSIVSGRLYDRMKGHPVISASFVLMAAMLALAPTLGQLWLLLFVMFILSIAEGAVDVGGNTLLVWVQGRKVGPYMNALHFFFGIGAFLAPIAVAQAILWHGDFNRAYWVIALVMFVPMIWHLRVPSPAHPTSDDSQDTNGRPNANANTLLVVLIAVCFFLYVGIEIAFGGWIASYAVAVGFGNAAAAAVLTSAFWGAFTLGRLFSIPVGARFSARAIMFADFAGCFVSTVIMLIGRGSPVVMWLGTIGIGLSIASMFPTMISFAESRMKITGKITSIFLTGSSIGGMTLPWLVGQLFESTGPQIMLWVVLTTTIAAAGVFAIVNHVSNRQRKP